MRRGASLDDIQRAYEHQLGAFVRTASAICGGREAGRDAVHDAVVAAVKGRRGFRGEGTIEAWLWKAVVRAAQLQRRRADLHVDLDRIDEARPAGSPEDSDVAAVRTAIAQLPERQRMVVFLRYYGDLGYEQIASALGIELGTVGATLHAAQRTLRAHLERLEDDVRCV